MAITVNTNLNALRAIRRLDTASQARGEVFERLASGLRINRPSDDAGGLSVATSLNADARIYAQAVRNVNDTVSLLNIADGATRELSSVLVRLRELATQSSTGTLSDTQRRSLDAESQALQAEYNRIIESTKYNGISVFENGRIQVQAGYGVQGALTLSYGEDRVEGVGDGTFGQGTSFVAAAGATSIVNADLNGDGNQDLILGGAQTAILLGNGDGTFRARQLYSPGPAQDNVIVTDLNNDGILDLAGSEGATFFLGAGDGTFGPRQYYATSWNPSFISAADVNGDGNMDIIGADWGSDTISVVFGNGNGTFSARQSLAAGSGSWVVATGDVNGDGYEDIIGADWSGSSVGVYLGNGNGTFQARRSLATGVNPYAVLTGDVNGDGNLDFVTIDEHGPTATVHLGNGDGTFHARQSFVATSLPWSGSLGDVNDDGRVDLIVADRGGSSVSILLGNGNGTFQAQQIVPSGNGPSGVVAVDLNGDGILDIATAESGTGKATVLLGNGTSSTVAHTLSALGDIQISTRTGALAAQSRLDDHLGEIQRVTSMIGASISRLSFAVSNLQVSFTEATAAASRITDIDVAEESAKLLSTGILQQSAAAVLAQANQQTGLVLMLLG